jgi:hypothetical protein
MFTTSSNSIDVPHRGIPAAGDHLVREYREQGGPAGFPEPPHSTTRLEVYGAPGPKVAATAIHAGALLTNDLKIIDIATRKIPIAIWVGTNDPYFALILVRATRDAFESRGFPAQLTEMPGHDHNYYAVAAKINPTIWEFLEANTLKSDPLYREYRKQSGARVRAACFSDDPVESYCTISR